MTPDPYGHDDMVPEPTNNDWNLICFGEDSDVEFTCRLSASMDRHATILDRLAES